MWLNIVMEYVRESLNMWTSSAQSKLLEADTSHYFYIMVVKGGESLNRQEVAVPLREFSSKFLTTKSEAVRTFPWPRIMSKIIINGDVLFNGASQLSSSSHSRYPWRWWHCYHCRSEEFQHSGNRLGVAE